MQSSLFSLLFFFDGLLTSSNEPSSSSGDETDFLTMGSISADSRGVTNMLLVTTTMRMVYWVHSHTSNSWPSSALRLVLVVLASCLANWLIGSSSSSTYSNHGSAVTWNGSSATTGKSDSGLSSVIWVTDDDCWCSTGSSKWSSVSSLSFTVWNNGTFRKEVNWQDIADWEWSLWTSIHELTSVHTFHCNEILSTVLISVRISEDHSCKRCSTAWVVNDFLDYSFGISFSFLVIQSSELSWSYSFWVVGHEDWTCTLSLA